MHVGNICRSPMAEAVLAHTIKERGLADRFTVDSAGTSGWHIGELPDARSVACCRRHNVPVDHKARQVTVDDFHRFDYIFCMDESNLHNLMRMKPANAHAVVKLFGDYDPKGERIIEDPYYGGDDSFEHNFQQVTRCSIAFLESLGL
ncbi:phosphotyrosine protein phosphatase I superfamily [Syncephalis pseudoplumigaleata]|uniref:Phosphotyrosine protein phosphatase I superfamily n=1 Tax=Syncephalis pseudoplumigaleata TaxID=1712513 RepID=A0A4P9Z3E4_9FUNG|nr:phosphotyrosine protein phosphatase I superfamily [Syncephalis pseudoplumigaleata]|eukprot:RKP26976.1 phosphotyrosine protein phosphatase I superfamily [Syncephalis pseudoplumigaleata]